jgi:S-adenosylmethionine synthetase
VGKLYTAISSLISEEIFHLTGLEIYVYFTSQMGRSLSDPWFACVDVRDREATPTERQMIEKVVEHALYNANETTRKIIRGELNLF